LRIGISSDVMLEFEREGHIVERYTIPWQGWEAFKIAAVRQGKSGKDYLTLLLGTGMAEGEAIGEMIHWLFSVAPSKEAANGSPEPLTAHAQ
jgi:hypothetical protein